MVNNCKAYDDGRDRCWMKNGACLGEDMCDIPRCGECCYLMEEDIHGRGYCAIKDLYTTQHCSDIACTEILKK
jgi:hypothetical protein